LVCPFLLKEKSESLGNIPRQEDFLILESYLKEIILPLVPKLSDTGIRLLSAEIMVAIRIRLGKSTGQIAGLLHSSDETLNSCRKNIRKKWE
jgi:DNA-binding NarL/FixJ family response regulator